jgi:hypothetical protein
LYPGQYTYNSAVIRLAEGVSKVFYWKEILDSNQQGAVDISTNKIVVPPDCCNFCGKKKHSDKKDCPARENKCSCGVKGHFRRLCYRDGNPRHPRLAKSSGKDDSKEKEDTKTKLETGQSIHESYFNIQL